MKIRISHILIVGFLVFFTACSGGGGGSSSSSAVDDGSTTEPPPTESTTKTLSGTIIDGLIKEATVCLDINANKQCDADEPTTTTADDGTFTLDIDESLSGSYKVISQGGIDTATNQFFDGVLEEIVEVNEDDTTIQTRITPLTTIASKIYDEEIANDSTFTPTKAKEKLAVSLGLTTAQISANPLEDTVLFAKTQKIVQATRLLTTTIQKDTTDRAINQEVFNTVLTQIALSLNESTAGEDLNVSQVVTNLKADDDTIVIPQDVESFVQNYADEVETKINETTDLSDLTSVQNGLETYVAQITTIIQTSETLSTDLDNTLATVEQTSTSTIIETAQSPKSLLTRSVEIQSGDTTNEAVTAECGSLGGIAVYSGIDSNNDGDLSISEQNETPQVVCNGSDGVNGFTSLIDTVVLAVGDVNCPDGGVTINFGLDLNTNAVLDIDTELSQSINLCNATDGTDGIAGTDGLNGVDGSDATVTSSEIPFSQPGTLSGTVPIEAQQSPARSLRAVTSMTGGLWLTPSIIEAAIAEDKKAKATVDSITVPEPVVKPISIPIASDGSYEVTGLPSNNDYALVYINSLGKSKKIENITITPGTVVTQNILSTELLDPGSIKMLVSSGVNLSGAVVRLNELDKNVTTTADGVAEFSNIPVGTYSVTISHDDYVSRYKTLIVSGNVETNIGTIELTTYKGVLSGRVSATDVDDYSNIIVYAQGIDGSVYTTFTSSNGNYVFNALPVGDGYSVIAYAHDYQSDKVNSLRILNGETTIANTINLVKYPSASFGSISGFARFDDVTDSFNHAGIIVSVENTDFEAITSRDGAFILNNITEGDYTLNFTDSNHRTVTKSVSVVSASTTYLSVELEKYRLLSDTFGDIELSSSINSYATLLNKTDLVTGAVSFSVSSSDNSVVSASIDHLGELTLNPVGTVGQSATIIIQVDFGSIGDTRTFDVEVSSNALLWDLNASIDLDEDTTLNTSFTNASGYSLSQNSTHSSSNVSSNGLTTITPEVDYFGLDALTIDNSIIEFNINLNYEAINDASTITYTPESVVAGNLSYTNSVTTNDVDGDSIDLNITMLNQPEYSNISIVDSSSIQYTLYCNPDVNGTTAPPYVFYVPVYEQDEVDIQTLIDNNVSIEVCNDASIASYTISDDYNISLEFTPDRVGTYEYEITLNDGTENSVYTYSTTVSSAWQKFKDGIISLSPVYGNFDMEIYNNNMYAIYASFYSDSKLELVEYNGTSWSLMSLDGIDATSLLEDSEIKIYNGVPHIMVMSNNEGFNGTSILDVYSYNNSVWSKVGGASIKDSLASQSADMFVDENGLYVTLTSEYNGDATWDRNTSVFKLVDNSWETITGSGYIQYDVSSTPGVSTLVNKDQVYALEDIYNAQNIDVSYYDGTSWNVQATTISNENIYIKDKTIRNAKPIVVIGDSDDNLTVKEFDGTNWNTLGTQDFIQASMYSIQITTINDKLYLAYPDPDYNLNIVKYEDSNNTWSKVGESMSMHDMGGTSHRKIFSNYDKPYVAYTDWAENGLTYLNLINYETLSPSLQTATPSKLGDAYPTQEIALIFDKSLTSATVELVDKDGTPVATNSTMNDNQIILSPSTSLLIANSPYEFTVSEALSVDGYSSNFDSTSSFNIISSTLAFKTGQASLQDYDDGNYSRGTDHNYTLDASVDPIVIDNVTGLIWDNTTSHPKKNYDDAITYCQDLDYADKTDWRLPVFNELYSIVKVSEVNQSVDTSFDFDFTLQSGRFWTSSRTPYNNASTYELTRTFVSLEYGFYDNYLKTSELDVKCVRGEMKDEVFSRDDVNEIVVDHKRGVMWQDDAGVNVGNGAWSSSVAYCEDLTLGGYTNWSMPNVSELSTIIDIENYAFGLNSVFANDRGYYYWTSTLDTYNSVDTSWLVYTGGGSSNLLYGQTSDTNFYTRCMRVIE